MMTRKRYSPQRDLICTYVKNSVLVKSSAPELCADHKSPLPGKAGGILLLRELP